MNSRKFKNAFLLGVAVTLGMLTKPLLAATSVGSCENLFPAQGIFAYLSSDKLKKENLELVEDPTLHIYRLLESDGRFIAVVKVIDSPNLYEWADLDYQQPWMEGGGLSAKDVLENVKHASQNMGRGFYVSTDPFDSKGYGPALSVFKTKGPMLVLQFGLSQSYSGKVEQVERFRRAGFDAFFNGRTWLAMISSRHLKAAKQINDPVWNNPHLTDKILDILPRLEMSQMTNKFEVDTFVGRIYKDQLNSEDKAIINSYFDRKDVHMERASYRKFNSIKRIYEERSAPLKLQITEQLRGRDINGLRNILGMAGAADQLVDMLTSGNPMFNRNIFNTLKVFDIQNIMSVLAKQNYEVSSLKKLMREAYLFDRGMAKVDLTKIKDYPSFLKQASVLLGQEPEARDKLVVMTAENNPDDQTIQLGIPAYNEVISQLGLNVKEAGRGRYNVDYPKLNGYKRFIPFLTQKLQREIADFEKKNPLDADETYQSQEGKRLLKKYLFEMTQTLFDPAQARDFVRLYFRGGGEVTNFKLYQTFVSLHPFADANGRLARLFYRYLAQENESEMILPLYDLDLFTPAKELPEMINKAKIINAWVSTARTQDELNAMIPSAYQLMKELFPNYAEQFLY